MDMLNQIDAWQVWVIVGVLFIIAEVLGTEFILLAIGFAFTVTGLVTKALGLDTDMQLLCAGISVAVFVPLFMRFYRKTFKPKGTKSLVSEGVGTDQDLEVVNYSGRLGVRIQGDFYPAATEDGTRLKAGDWVRLIEMRGLTAYVELI